MEADGIKCLRWLGERVVDVLKDAPGSAMTIGVLTEHGRGDVARSIAFAEAVRARHPLAYIVLIFPVDHTMCKWDMAQFARQCGVINAYVGMPMNLPRGAILTEIAQDFTVLFDTSSIAVKAYWYGGEDAERDQVRADRCLAPYRIVYDADPRGRSHLNDWDESQWDVMRNSSGYEVDPKGLSCAAPLDCFPFPGEEELPPDLALDELKKNSGGSNPERAAVHGLNHYAVIHASAGHDSNTKLPTVALFEAITERLGRSSIRCVQVGTEGETELKFAIKRVNLRLPLTNRLIKGAIALIDVEGFLPYMAYGLDVRAAVLFGPTPRSVFGFDTNRNIYRAGPGWKGMGCPLGNCFWGGPGGWAMPGVWQKCCQLGHPSAGGRNPEWPVCANFPPPVEAANAIATFIEELAYGEAIVRPQEATA